MKIEFVKGLEEVINKYSRENASNTPDFVLAEYLLSTLVALETAIQQREAWYGRDARPTYTTKEPQVVNAKSVEELHNHLKEVCTPQPISRLIDILIDFHDYIVQINRECGGNDRDVDQEKYGRLIDKQIQIVANSLAELKRGGI